MQTVQTMKTIRMRLWERSMRPHAAHPDSKRTARARYIALERRALRRLKRQRRRLFDVL